MTTNEMQRLTMDLLRDATLRGRLAPALEPGARPEEAAAMLQAAGYLIGPEHLRRTVSVLDDDELDTVTGGNMTARNLKSPFEDQ